MGAAAQYQSRIGIRCPDRSASPGQPLPIAAEIHTDEPETIRKTTRTEDATLRPYGLLNVMKPADVSSRRVVDTVQRAVRTRDHLMVRTYDDFGYRFDPVELYDMANDPYQTKNLRDDKPDVLAQHDHLLAEWMHEQMTKDYAIPDPLQLVLQERATQRRGRR